MKNKPAEFRPPPPQLMRFLYRSGLGHGSWGKAYAEPELLPWMFAQRLGPATGGATTPGQGDVQFVRWGTSGGYPIIALAPILLIWFGYGLTPKVIVVVLICFFPNPL